MRAFMFVAVTLFMGMAFYAAGSEQQPRSVRLEMRILRFDFEKDGIADVETAGSPVAMTMNNTAAKIALGSASFQQAIEILPHINTDGSYKLTGKVICVENGKTRAVPFSRTIPKGQGRIVAGYTDSTLALVQKAVAKGQIPNQPVKHTAFYWQVTPSVERE